MNTKTLWRTAVVAAVLPLVAATRSISGLAPTRGGMARTSAVSIASGPTSTARLRSTDQTARAGVAQPARTSASRDDPLMFDPQPTREARSYAVDSREVDLAVGGGDRVIGTGPLDQHTKDDATIHMHLYDPDTSAEPDWPKPVIVTMGFNYDDDAVVAAQQAALPAFAAWYAFLPNHEVPRGYTVIEADMRGSGSSTGCFNYWGPDDAQDFRDVVTWASTYDGRQHPVGAFGGSAEAMVIADGMRGAGSALKTVVQVESSSSLYDAYAFDGVPYDGTAGFEASYWAESHVGSVDAYAGNAARPGCLPDALLGTDYSGTESPFFVDRDYRRGLATVGASVLDIVGLLDDTNLPIRPDGYDDQLPSFHRVIAGQWGHAILDDPNDPNLSNPRLDLHAIFDAWFDHFLGGADNGVKQWPAVQVQDPRGVWRAVADIASMGSPRSLPLGPNGQLGTAGQPGAVATLDATSPAVFETSQLGRIHLSGQVRMSLPIAFHTATSAVPTSGRLELDVIEHKSDNSGVVLTRGFRAADHIDSLEKANDVENDQSKTVSIRTNVFDTWIAADSTLQLVLRTVPPTDNAAEANMVPSTVPFSATFAVDGDAVAQLPIANDSCGLVAVQSPPNDTQLALTPSCPFKNRVI